jgi:hypothetical protein
MCLKSGWIINPSFPILRVITTVHLPNVGLGCSSVGGVSYLLGVVFLAVNEKCPLEIVGFGVVTLSLAPEILPKFSRSCVKKIMIAVGSNDSSQDNEHR